MYGAVVIGVSAFDVVVGGFSVDIGVVGAAATAVVSVDVGIGVGGGILVLVVVVVVVIVSTPACW